MNRRVVRSVAVILSAWLALSTAAMAASELRLAGTMQTANRGWMALVSIDGAQRWVRVDDPLGGGTVTAVADRVLRVRFASGEQEYRIGADRAVAAPSARLPALPVGASGLHGTIGSDSAMVEGLKTLAASAKGRSAAELEAEFNRLLALPPTMRLVGSDPSYLTTHRAAPVADSLAQINADLAFGNAARVVLTEDGQVTTIYLRPPPGTVPVPRAGPDNPSAH